MKINTVIFDLDGTLLDTLDDLTDSTNYALKDMGMPERSREEVKRFVGNGAERLIRLAVPCESSADAVSKTLHKFREHYDLNCRNKTVVYPQIYNAMKALRDAGYKLAIVSNKPQSAVTLLYEQYFRSFSDVAIGQRENMAKKPAPDMVFAALRELGAQADAAVYVGDSEVDIMTSKNAGIPCISVTWGFRDRLTLERSGGYLFAEDPMQMIELIENLTVR